MSKKTELITFLISIFVLVVMVFAYNFLHYYTAKEYPLYSYTSCDPSRDSCFEVDPESENFAFYTEPYAKVDIIARYAPTCLNEHTCTNFTCIGIEDHCTVTYCSDEVLEDGELCSTLIH